VGKERLVDPSILHLVSVLAQLEGFSLGEQVVPVASLLVEEELAGLQRVLQVKIESREDRHGPLLYKALIKGIAEKRCT